MIRVGSSLLGLLVAGKLDKYTSVGCYPLFYVVRCFKDEAVWCARCCNEATDPDAVIIACDANWEDPDLTCDACSERIESAYAEDENPASESASGGLPDHDPTCCCFSCACHRNRHRVKP
jgi:hypothetical protein